MSRCSSTLWAYSTLWAGGFLRCEPVSSLENTIGGAVLNIFVENNATGTCVLAVIRNTIKAMAKKQRGDPIFIMRVPKEMLVDIQKAVVEAKMPNRSVWARSVLSAALAEHNGKSA